MRKIDSKYAIISQVIGEDGGDMFSEMSVLTTAAPYKIPEGIIS
jgi:hypothetical protein